MKEEIKEEFRTFYKISELTFHELNRPTNQSNVQKIANSITKEGFQVRKIQVYVNSKGELIVGDGQHTTKACLLILNRPVEAIVTYGLSDEEIIRRMVVSNSIGSNWRDCNYANLHKTKELYKQLETLKHILPLVDKNSFNQTISGLPKDKFNEQFRDGTLNFEISEDAVSKLTSINNLVKLAKEEREFVGGDKISDSVLSSAFTSLIVGEEISPKKVSSITKKFIKSFSAHKPTLVFLIKGYINNYDSTTFTLSEKSLEDDFPF